MLIYQLMKSIINYMLTSSKKGISLISLHTSVIVTNGLLRKLMSENIVRDSNII